MSATGLRAFASRPCAAMTHVGRESLQRGGEQRCGACVNAVLEHHRQAMGRAAGSGACRRRGRTGRRRNLHEKFAHRELAIEALPQDAKAAVGGDDDRCQHTARAPREQVEIEAKERITGAHPRALAHMRLEPLPCQRDRVETDVQEDLAAAGGAQRHRVA